MSHSTFTRKMPPLAARCAMGVVMDGLVRPGVWGLERLGLTSRVLPRLMPSFSQQAAKRNPFAGYVPSSHDVFVATYVKSGTNWMMHIAHQLLHHGLAEFDHIHCAVPWPDLSSGPMRGYAIPIGDDSVWRASPEQKRVIKTHFDWTILPYAEDARYISVIRDPKDVFVSSYFFFVKNTLGTTLSVDSWLKLFLSERFPMWGSWAENTANYWAQRHRRNVLIASFKAMKHDLRATVRRVATFLDVRASNEVIDRVCEKTSFEYMKRHDEKFRMWKMIPWRGDGTMIRSGRHGGSSELLTPARQREVDDFCRAELRRLGSDFPYDEFCDVAREPLVGASARLAVDVSAVPRRSG